LLPGKQCARLNTETRKQLNRPPASCFPRLRASAFGDVRIKNGIPCGICGEAGADPLLTRFLIGSDIDELSMTGASILCVREEVRRTSYADVREKIEKQLFTLDNTEDAVRFLGSL